MLYVIQGDPIPLARARHGAKKVYDCQRHQKLVHGIDLRNQHDNQPLFLGPLHLIIVFYVKIPQAQAKKNISGKPHVSKPDLSNLIKYVEDVATGILYPDDKQVCKITARKEYDEHPRTEFKIEVVQ